MSDKWTPREEQIMCRWYPSLGTKVAEKLTGRTHMAVSKQSIRMGLSRDKFYWSKADAGDLQLTFDLGGLEVCLERFPYRNQRQIMAKLYAMGNPHVKRRCIKGRPASVWMPDHVKLLKACYPRLDVREIAALLPNHTWKQVENKMYALGLHTQRRSVAAQTVPSPELPKQWISRREVAKILQVKEEWIINVLQRRDLKRWTRMNTRKVEALLGLTWWEEDFAWTFLASDVYAAKQCLDSQPTSK